MIKKLLKVNHNHLKQYIEYTFDVNPDTNSIDIEFDYERCGGENVVDFALKSEDQFLGATGGAYTKVHLSNDNFTSPGYPVGLKQQYTIVFRIYKVFEDFEINLEITQNKKELKAWKVDFHSHTFCSDGRYTLNQVDNFAQNKKLDIVAITDHFAMNANRFISDQYQTQMLLGFELTMQWGHMGIFNLPAEKVKYQFTTAKEVEQWLEQIKQEHDVFRIVNHPYANCDDCDWKLGFDYEALEIFNSFDINNNIKSLERYQEELENGHYFPIICGSDTHKHNWLDDNHSTHGFPTTIVKSENKSMASIIAGVKNYNAVCTYYPEIDICVGLKSGELIVENLPLDSHLKIYTEKGEIAPDDQISYNEFIRFEVWQKREKFEDYINTSLETELKFDTEFVPIYVTNPIFRRK